MMDALVFAIPCLLSLEFTLVGRLFAAEILMLALAPILLLYRARLLAAPVPRTVLILGCMWLFSQIATDVIRGIPFGDYSRGWSKIAFTLINFSVLYMLLHNSRRRLVHFAVGLVIGVYFHHVLSPVPGAETEPWKFGLALPVTMMFVLGAQWGFERNATRMVSILLVVASGINLMMGFRSLAGICFVTAIFLFSQSRRLRPGARISGRRLALFAVIGTLYRPPGPDSRGSPAISIGSPSLIWRGSSALRQAGSGSSGGDGVKSSRIDSVGDLWGGRLWMVLVLVLILLGGAPSDAAVANSEDPFVGTLFVKAEDGVSIPAVALSTHVEIVVSGFVARAKVTQRFTNDTDLWLEGVYVFPLPEMAAVDSLTLTVGERRIEGQIQERAWAKRSCQRAKS